MQARGRGGQKMGTFCRPPIWKIPYKLQLVHALFSLRTATEEGQARFFEGRLLLILSPTH